MFCSNCGAQLEDGSVFCSNCGSQVGAAQASTPVNNTYANPNPNAYIPTIQTITNTNKPQQIQSEENQKIINSYSTTTNTIIKDNKILNSKNSNPLDLFSKPNENHINNYYITNKPEIERFTVIDDLIQPSKTPLVNKDVDVTYNDFDGSGFVKNYGGVSRPGKDSSGKRKTNQDALVCLTNIIYS